MREVEADIERDLVDSRANPLKVVGHLVVVDILRELVGCPLFLAIHSRETEVVDQVTIVLRVLPVNDRIVAIDADCSMIVRHRKSQDLAVELLLALHQPEQLHDGPHRDRRAVRVLPVCDVQRRRAVLDLASRKAFRLKPAGKPIIYR